MPVEDDSRQVDLVIQRLASVAESYSQLPGGSTQVENGIGLAEYLRVARKHKGTVAICAFCCMLLGVGFVLPKPPVYRASAQLEVQALNEEFGYSKDVSVSSTSGGMFPDVDLATQVKVLGAQSLQDRVVAKLDADTSLQVQPPRDRFAAWKKALHLPGKSVPDRLDAIREAAGSVTIKPIRTSRVIEIQCESEDPRLAAAYANTLAQEYIEQTVETRWQSAKHTGEWLTRQLDEIKVNLEKSEDQLQRYATSMNLVFSGDKDRTNVTQERLSQVQSELSTAQADRVTKQSRYELAMSGPPEALGQVVDDATLRVFEGKLLDLRRELAELTATLGPAHDRVKKVKAQIAEMEADQKKARDRIVDRIGNDYREADRREKLLEAAYKTQASFVSDQASKITHYNILKREVDSNRQLYESLLQKVKEAAITSALRASNIQIIDVAKAPMTPFTPDLKKGAFIGLLIGLLGGFGLVFIREKMSRVLQAPGEAPFHLQVPELGIVPSWSIDRALGVDGVRRFFGAGLRKEGDEPAISAFRHSHSLAAEAFRVILTSILYIGRRRPAQVLVVGSPGASEGKTTVISNLALGLAETNRTVLLIDCDMRRPRLHSLFDLPNETGLATLLAKKESLDPRDLILATRPTRFAGVSVLTSGALDSGAAALLHSVRLPELISLAREQFDAVLIDTPPMLHLADARIVGALSDGVMLVLRSGHTSRDAALSVRRRLQEDGIPVFGSVLNDWNPKAAGYYGYESYSQYYSSFYAKGVALKEH
jgi:succinoglycan biosynthesis transport protein ExoP